MTGPGGPGQASVARQAAADPAADPAADAVSWFAQCYGTRPGGVWHAPGRANLIGEHTDYNDGWVLPFALRRGIVVAAAGRDDGVLELRSRQEAGPAAALKLAALEPGAVTGWAAYPAGVAWALRTAGYPVTGASLAIDSDLPRGAGLSSSAALECAVALALTELSGITVPRPELAALARRAENDFAGMPSGIMDQAASLLCTAGNALLLDCRSLGTEQVPFQAAGAGATLLIIDTRHRHALVGGEYAQRRGECERAAQALGVTALRDVALPGPALDARLADPVLRCRARHVITENLRVTRTAELLRSGQLAAVGPLLTASHVSLRDDFQVSWPAADTAVDVALGAGALGARMIGGGFGGSVIALAPADRVAAIRGAVTDAYAARGWPEPGWLDEQPSAGARRLS